MTQPTASNHSAPFTLAENVCLLEKFNSYKDILLGKSSKSDKIAGTVDSVNQNKTKTPDNVLTVVYFQ